MPCILQCAERCISYPHNENQWYWYANNKEVFPRTLSLVIDSVSILATHHAWSQKGFIEFLGNPFTCDGMESHSLCHIVRVQKMIFDGYVSIATWRLYRRNGNAYREVEEGPREVSLLRHNDMEKNVHCTVFDRHCAPQTAACRKYMHDVEAL